MILVARPMGIERNFIAPTPKKLLISCFFKLNALGFRGWTVKCLILLWDPKGINTLFLFVFIDKNSLFTALEYDLGSRFLCPIMSQKK
jgi:hypothetical protein